MNILAWEDELGLSNSQADQLKAIEEKATADVRALLSDEQKTKLGWDSASKHAG